MKNLDDKFYFSPLEEKINIITHGLGIPLSIVALIFLIINASINGDTLDLISFIIFGVSLILVYTASTLFHSTQNLKQRRRFNLIDHASIYVLIAGTYTPFALITLEGKIGWIIFSIIWGLAILGIIYKILYIGKSRLISTASYVIMGWLIIAAINPLVNNLSLQGLVWLFGGAISYSVGAFLYSRRKLKFNHATFHIFVLMGSFCHFISIYYHVL